MAVRLCVISNAGGSGKTTVSVHLAYGLAQQGFSVVLIDLDPQGSLTLFCGLSAPLNVSQSTAIILEDEFKGNWPLVNAWSEETDQVKVCQGGLILAQVTPQIVLHPRGAYLLKDALEDYPLSQSIIIFDCPATLGPLALLGVAAATHILIPVQLQPKSIQGSSKLLEWLYLLNRQLRLRPEPQVLGILPNQYDRKQATQRQLLEFLPPKLAQINLKCYAPIRASAEFINASGAGLPLQLYRPSHPAYQDFNEVVQDLGQLIRESDRE